MLEKDLAIAIYNTHTEAEEAIKKLQKRGFDMKKLSIVGKDYHTEEQPVGYYNTGNRMKYWGGLGAFWGGVWGLVFGFAFFFIPGLGPIAIGGPLVGILVSSLEGALAVGGLLSVLGAALYSIGIPKDSVIKYEMAIKANKFVVMVNGGESEVEDAHEFLQTSKPLEVAIHHL